MGKETKMDCSTNISTKDQAKQVIIVTGLSGAGKTSVMRSLEDLGYYYTH